MKLTKTLLPVSVLVVSAGLALPALADKPEWSGSKGKPDSEQVDAHKEAMKEKRGGNADMNGKGEMHEKGMHDKGMGDQEKMQKHDREHMPDDMKANMEDGKKGGKPEKMKGQPDDGKPAVEKEMKKEQPDAAQDTSRKWWKFWGE